MSLLALACKKTDGDCFGNTSTHSEECVIVVHAVTGRIKHSTGIDRKVNSPLKLTSSEMSLDVDMSSHACSVKFEEPDKNSSGMTASSDKKWTALRRKKMNGKKL